MSRYPPPGVFTCAGKWNLLFHYQCDPEITSNVQLSNLKNASLQLQRLPMDPNGFDPRPKSMQTGVAGVSPAHGSLKAIIVVGDVDEAAA